MPLIIIGLILLIGLLIMAVLNYLKDDPDVNVSEMRKAREKARRRRSSGAEGDKILYFPQNDDGDDDREAN